MSFDPFTTARRLTNTELVNFSAIPAREKAGRSQTIEEALGVLTPIDPKT